MKVSHYTYGRYGSTTTIELENILKGLEEAYHVFLTGTGFGGVALAIMSLCRPGDEILVSDNVYGPKKAISEKRLLKTLKNKFYTYFKGFILFFYSENLNIKIKDKNICDIRVEELTEKFNNSISGRF